MFVVLFFTRPFSFSFFCALKNFSRKFIFMDYLRKFSLLFFVLSFLSFILNSWVVFVLLLLYKCYQFRVIVALFCMQVASSSCCRRLSSVKKGKQSLISILFLCFLYRVRMVVVYSTSYPHWIALYCVTFMVFLWF